MDKIHITKRDKLTFVLSLYVLIELYISYLITYSTLVKQITFWVDNIICIIFLYDFFYGFIKAKLKLNFLKSNFIDFIASIPSIIIPTDILRIGRVVKIIKLLRIIRSQKNIFEFFLKKNATSTFKLLVYLNIFLVIIFSLSIFLVEHKVNPNFSSIGESFWWAISIMLVSEYENAYPITTFGKVIMFFLIIGGLTLLGSFIAMLSDYFIKDESIEKRLEKIEEKLDKLLSSKEK